MRWPILLLLLAATSGCSTIEKINTLVDRGIAVATDVKAQLDAAKVAVAKADADGDGKLSWQELVAMLGILGGGIAGALGLNKKVNAVAEKQSAKRAEVWEQINDLRDKVVVGVRPS